MRAIVAIVAAVGVVGVVGAGLVAGRLASRDEHASSAPAAAAASARPASVEAERHAASPKQPAVAAAPASVSAPASAASAPAVLPAAETLAEARLHGERRTPPIDPPDPAAPRAAPWELADPAAYQARESRLAREVDARFVAAAQARLGEQRAALAEAQARGASPEDLARAEDKIRHLEAAQAALIASGAAAAP
jgi:hypothetical protein